MIESLPSSRDPLIINFPPSISHIGNSELPFSSFRQSMPATHQQQQQLLVSSEIEKLTTDEDVHIQAISPPPPAPPNPSSLLTTLPPELLQDCIVGRYLCLRDAARFNRVSRYSHALENQVLFDKYSSTLELLVALQQSLIAHSSNNRVFINGEFLSPAACRRIINNLNKPPLDSLSTDELMLAMEILFMEMKRLEDHNDWAKIPRSSSRVYHLREIFITRIHMLAQPILNHNTSSWLVMDNFRNIVDSISVLAVKYHCQEILQLIFTSLVRKRTCDYFAHSPF